MRDIGRMAESLFESFCAQLGLICNKSSTNDGAGWDYVVDFPLPCDNSIPLDCDYTRTPIRLQVKGTDSTRKSYPGVKLSNLKRMIEDPLPTFFFVCNFDKKNEPTSIHLVHVDELIIEKVLRRLRGMNQKGLTEPHKYKMSVPLASESLLADVTSSALENSIKTHLAISNGFYAEKKLNFLKTCGYQSSSQVINFTTKSLKSEEDLSRFLVGDPSIGPVEVGSLDIYDIRFQLKALNPHKSFNGGTIELLPSEGKTFEIKLFLDGEEQKEILHLMSVNISPQKVQAYQGPIALFTSPVARFLMKGRSGGIEANFSLPTDDNDYVILDDLFSYQDLIRLFSSKLDSQTQHSKLIFFIRDVEKSSSFVRMGTLDRCLDVSEKRATDLGKIKNLRKLAEHCGLSGHLRISLTELDRISPICEIFKDVLAPTASSSRLRFTKDSEVSFVGEDYAIIFFTMIKFQDDVLVLAFRFDGESSLVDEDINTVEMKASRVTVIRERLVKRQAWGNAALKSFSEVTLSTIDNENIVILGLNCLSEDI